MFGGTGETSQAKSGYNLLSRVLGETFISTTPAGSAKSYTANAVDEETLSTEQAFMTILKVPAETAFIGVVTLKDPTPETAALLCDNLERLTRLGASTREWGRCRTELLGCKLDDRETLATYDLAGQELKKIEEQLSTLKALELPSVEPSLKQVASQLKEVLPKAKGKK
jgi:CRISPR type I-D-associated protein Csc2